jgi:GMP synthase (glutamine-hydrolysing)
MKKQIILVIDFGSQYTQLIARRIRELNVYSEILPHTTTCNDIKKMNPLAIILSGGPASVYEEKAPQIDNDIFNIEIPILGICYGLQLLVSSFGGSVIHKGHGEYGSAELHIQKNSQLFKNLPNISKVWMSHGDEIENIGLAFDVIGTSSNNVIGAIRHKERPFYGVQFHPEVVHTIQGKEILSNFLFNISKCIADWTAKNFIVDSIKEIRRAVGEKGQVITGISGGVDSSVVGALLQKAIGERSNCVFIDHGLLRKNESNQVMSSLQRGLGFNINKYDQSELFLSALEGISDPEKKRKIIGREFIRSFEKASSKINDANFLAQGTLYPDVIESGGSAMGPSVTIKSHHNVGGLPDDMNFQLIEPIRNLFKDEVRAVGRELGLPDFILNRHPFPGPGLAVRIIGEITLNRISILQDADEIFIKLLHKHGEYDKIWQAFAVLISIKTVGVMGDARTYENLIALRAVSSIDGMTAEWYEMPYDLLSDCSTEIINKVKGVNRVVYDITSKPPGTIEWE